MDDHVTVDQKIGPTLRPRGADPGAEGLEGDHVVEPGPPADHGDARLADHPGGGIAQARRHPVVGGRILEHPGHAIGTKEAVGARVRQANRLHDGEHAAGRRAGLELRHGSIVVGRRSARVQ